MSIDTVINSLSIPAEQKAAIHALAELIEAAYPGTIPTCFHGPPAQQQQQLINALAAYCDRGPIASLALSDGHHPLFDRVTPSMWQRFVTARASSLPGSQTWVPKSGQPVLLLVPGGHLSRLYLRRQIALDAAKKAREVGGDVLSVVSLPGDRDCYTDEVKTVRESPGRYPDCHRKSASRALTEYDISCESTPRFAKEINLTDGQIHCVNSPQYKVCYPPGHKVINRATTRDNAVALAEWLLNGPLKDKLSPETTIVLCIEAPFHQRMANVFTTVFGALHANPVMTMVTEDDLSDEATLKRTQGNNKASFALVNQVYCIAREYPELVEIKEHIRSFGSCLYERLGATPEAGVARKTP